MTNTDSHWLTIQDRLQALGTADLAIEAFRRHYEHLLTGGISKLSEAHIQPVGPLTGLEDISEDHLDPADAVAKTVVLKLNGGLGTSMGLAGPKSFLTVKDDYSFFDLIVQQVRSLRSRMNCTVPLILMNSAGTEGVTAEGLERYPDIGEKQIPIPCSFLQNRVVKLRQDSLEPVVCPGNPQLETCPPGHGDIYVALQTSGVLEALLRHGYRYAFVSNSDNLGATLDPSIAAYFARQGFPFMMEVTARTDADKKGGHLARGKDGRLLLREVAQCPDSEMESFTDIERHRYFNTNNLWIDLDALASTLACSGGVLDLPLIVNAKTVDPRDKASTAVYQLETAMGAAIGCFDGAEALLVPRTRFAPVKTTEDLLALRSDLFLLSDDSRVVSNPARSLGTINISLDAEHFRMLEGFQRHFPNGPPSLLECTELTVTGDVVFGRDVVLRGIVHLRNSSPSQYLIPDGSVYESDGEGIDLSQ
ncbi:MAG: UTP--glucose-1-phosphate uridylyltransferase [Verrucomicrobia bacterium]|nr:UTP--glucose-1-phosphate uridylyltransferase [Verrucomicrobiota bacterium]